VLWSTGFYSGTGEAPGGYHMTHGGFTIRLGSHNDAALAKENSTNSASMISTMTLLRSLRITRLSWFACQFKSFALFTAHLIQFDPPHSNDSTLCLDHQTACSPHSLTPHKIARTESSTARRHH
jgi:hypothetical protein